MSNNVDIQTVDGETILDEDDLPDVKDELMDCRHRWSHLGLSLRISAAELEAIKADRPTPEDGLTAVLLRFLRKNYNVKRFGEPTWRRLVEVVQNPAGGDNSSLAERIAKKYPVKTFDTPQQETPLPVHTTPPLAHDSAPQSAYGDDASVDHISFTFRDRKIVSDGGDLEHKIFEPHKHDKKTKLDLSFGTIQPKSGKKQANFGGYDMRQFPHGWCVIINNETFLRQTNREGTAIDEGNLVQTFRFLGYKVEVYQDRTVAQMEAIFDDMKSRDHSGYDSLICCLLTHGKEGKVYGSDSKELDITSIISKLNGENCKTLAGKPKLFFLQACRGRGKDAGTRVASDSGEVRIEADSDPISIPDESDFFFGYATPPGRVAWRDLDHGSWYVSELCRSLCSYAVYADLNHMIQETHEKVATNYKNEGYKQAPEFTTRLRKDVFFF